MQQFYRETLVRLSVVVVYAYVFPLSAATVSVSQTKLHSPLKFNVMDALAALW